MNMAAHGRCPFPLFAGEVVQVVGSVVAAAALRELRVNTFCVGQIVAITTCGHGFVFVGMTGDAGNIVMLGLGGHQLIKSGVVTGRAVNVGGGIRVLENQWLVDVVADSAVALGLGLSVWLVACGTLGDIAMRVGVAEVAGYICVLARVSDQLLILLGVAGETFCFQVAFEDDAQRLVRVVTAHAIRQLVVSRTFVTHAASRDVFRAARAVTGVAAEAIGFGLVLGPSFSNFGRLLGVALGAIGNAQLRLRESGAGGQQQAAEQGCQHGGQNDGRFDSHFAS